MIQCPYCGEVFEVACDHSSQGLMVQDCDVCCRPIEMIVHWDHEGRLSLELRRSGG